MRAGSIQQRPVPLTAAQLWRRGLLYAGALAANKVRENADYRAALPAVGARAIRVPVAASRAGLERSTTGTRHLY